MKFNTITKRGKCYYTKLVAKVHRYEKELKKT
jgi:hypothetical protein